LRFKGLNGTNGHGFRADARFSSGFRPGNKSRHLPALAATAAIVAVHSLFAALAVRWGWFSRIIKGRPTRLIEAGEIDWRRAKRALIGERDLEEDLRLHGVSGFDGVEAAHLERNGQISIVKRSQPHR